jgi:hypothetical protein
MLREIRAADVASQRERMLMQAERRMADAVGAALREFLRRVRGSITDDALTAAAGFPNSLRLFTLGEATGWWESAVTSHVSDEVQRVWRTGYFDTRDGEFLASSMQASSDYVANVTDRLSRTASPTIPNQAFDTARVVISQEIAYGSSTDTMARRLATEFGWDHDATFARARLAEVNGRLDSILDPLGPPGSPAREAARLGDPEVRMLQDIRSAQVRQIDRTESTWQTRSQRIARTETTGAYNAGSLDAAYVEGQRVKVWMATGDDRTRDTHLAASGQCVPVEDDFTVGGVPLAMPGDPSGPGHETIQCRCTMVYADSCSEASRRYGRVERGVIDEERERRDEPVDEDEPNRI